MKKRPHSFLLLHSNLELRTSLSHFSRFIFFRQLLVERLDPRLPLRVGKNQLDLLLHLFQLLIAEPREADPFLEESQRLIERQLLALESLHDLFELLEGLFEIVRAGAGHCDGSGQRLSTPSVRESTVQLSRPLFSCTSIESLTATTAESRIGLRPRLVREKAMA